MGFDQVTLGGGVLEYHAHPLCDAAAFGSGDASPNQQ